MLVLGLSEAFVGGSALTSAPLEISARSVVQEAEAALPKVAPDQCARWRRTDPAKYKKYCQ